MPMSIREYNTDDTGIKKIFYLLLSELTASKKIIRGLFRSWTTITALMFIIALILMALLAEFIAPHDPNAQNLSRRKEGPTFTHPFGLDEFGRDIFSRIIFGARVSLIVGISATCIAILLGLFFGLLSGYFGGKIDIAVTILSNIFLAFPGLLLAIGLITILGQNILNVIIAIALVNWPGYARIVRGQVLAIREMTFVEAAKLMGASDMSVIISHLLPNTISPLLVLATIGIGWSILAEAGLSFIGLGVKPPTPSWGAMISSGRNYLLDAPHIATIPGLFLTFTVLSFNIIGDYLRDSLDPRMKKI